MEDIINTLDNGLIQHIFEITQGSNTYRDALVMSQEEYALLTLEQISAMKQARFDNWIKVITTPVVEE